MLPIESYRAARWLRTINLVLQAVLFLTLFAGLNYLALHYHWRYDLSQHRRFSLSPETISYLGELKRPVRIVVTLTPDSENSDAVQAYHDVQNLLREYLYNTATSADAKSGRDGRITVDYLDVYQKRREAEALGVDQPDVILFLCGENHETVRLNQLYEFKDHRRTAFKGEQTITAAVLDVSNPEKKKIFFLAGHGEMSPDDVSPVRGLSGLADELRQRNFDLEGLDLSLTKRVPKGADVILIIAPRGPFQPFEEELLRQYLSTGAGRILLTLDPARECGLANLFYDWGVRVDDDVIHDDANSEFTADNGDLIIRHVDGTHPITKSLFDYGFPVRISPPRSVRPDPDRPLDNTLKVSVLAASSPTSWGEFGYRLKTPAAYTPGSDLKGPLGIVVSSERVTAGALPFSVPGGRLVVIGSGDLFSNRRLADSGCQALCLNAVNWAVDRDTQLHFPPRPIERFQLSLSQEDLAKLRLGLLLLLPGAVGLLGLMVYWTRRR
jgi:ABC-type uncharacterized transport system involved in gliding motility auxiliary subunit